MAKIFTQQAELNNHPARNNHDLTHQVHGTYQMGKIYPTLCKRVVPGDSFRIDSALGFKFMPLVTPTQTPMRVIQHFFYVRNKNIWDNWENWIQGLEEHEFPYIDQPASYYKTGSLADYLDVPTTVETGGVSRNVFNFANIQKETGSSGVAAFAYIWKSSAANFPHPGRLSGRMSSMDSGAAWYVLDFPFSLPVTGIKDIGRVIELAPSKYDIENQMNNGVMFETDGVFIRRCYLEFVRLRNSAETTYPLPAEGEGLEDAVLYRVDLFLNDGVDGDIWYERGQLYGVNMSGETINWTFKGNHIVIGDERREEINKNLEEWRAAGYEVFARLSYVVQTNPTFPGGAPMAYPVSGENVGVYLTQDTSEVRDLPDVPTASPYYHSKTNNGSDTIKLNALPFRAYESIYQSFYRNTQNQQFYVDGKPVYNKYNTCTGDGADTTPYALYRRNWEMDAYTSCMPSPQQGNAPLVAISALGNGTVTDPDTGVQSTFRAVDGPDGNMIVEAVNAETQEHMQIIMNMASAGISINDFRQVNALQRFLETNMRKGYRYVDFIEGHFGKAPSEAVMNMPEFIGGFAQRVDVNMVTNSTAPSGDPTAKNALGAFAGQANAFGGSPHTVSHYFDDFGWLIGIVCIVPQPAYSQLLPKHFSVRQPLDFYFPEFSQIGMQPITYEELCPIQSKLESQYDSNKKLTDVFGYQRPNHDMVWYPDTMHGQFRTTLNYWLINRMFSTRPELGNEFLQINPDETNNIFAVTTEDNDVVVGQIIYKITSKRPVPRIVIPSLGR